MHEGEGEREAERERYIDSPSAGGNNWGTDRERKGTLCARAREWEREKELTIYLTNDSPMTAQFPFFLALHGGV